MKQFTAFYAGLLYDESDTLFRSADMPNGVYMRSTMWDQITWYVHLAGGWTPINLCDVPKELQMICLLMS